MKKALCPNCGSKMIEDVFEEITSLPNGSIRLDTIYPAWVCSKFCGYYERIEGPPVVGKGLRENGC